MELQYEHQWLLCLFKCPLQMFHLMFLVACGLIFFYKGSLNKSYVNNYIEKETFAKGHKITHLIITSQSN